MLTPITCLLPIARITALFTITIQRKHLLISLLALEAIILSLCLAIPILSSKNNPSDTVSILTLLRFGACEAALGLSCLVILIRTNGNDLLKSTTTLKC